MLDINTNTISIVSDFDSWVNVCIEKFIINLRNLGYRYEHVYHHKDLKHHDVVCYLSYSRIVPKNSLLRSKHNLVVHESDLPKGKGWSPLTWQILQGKNEIPIVLFEADEKVDAGKIYIKKLIQFNGTELISELRQMQAQNTFDLIIEFLCHYNSIVKSAYHQRGKESYYPKRSPRDSKLDVNKSLKEQFNLLRVVDNEKYPAYFEINGVQYILSIYKKNGSQ